MNEHKKRKNADFRPSILVVGVIIIFLAIQGIGSVINGISTISALRFTADDSFFSRGWFFRDEVLAQGVSSETVEHIARSGEKVQKNAPLAVIYTDISALDASQKIQLLNDEIALLNSALQTTANNSDVSKLEQQITEQISTLSSQANTGVVSEMKPRLVKLRNLCLRRSAKELDSAVISAQLSAKSTERGALERQLTGRSTTITSPASGLFSEVVDGFEDKLTVQNAKTISINDFKALDESAISQTQSGNLGKVISSFRWYFVVCVPSSELEGLQKGSSLRLRFSQVDRDTAVNVEDIRKDKDGKEALLVLGGMDISPELVRMRCQSAEIIRTSYTGIRVPKSAVKIEVDAQDKQRRGVYILTGSMSRFKEIEVLYEADTYYVVKQGMTDENTGLVAGDRIIVKARGLEDRKVMK